MIVGVDYAEVDTNAAPSFVRFKVACAAAGSMAGFAIFRGAWGTSPDPTALRDWVAAKDAGLTCGAYLFLRMRADISPEDQVHVFADNVGALRNNDLAPILDIEDSGFPAMRELEYTHRAWLEVRRVYGVSPIIYDSARVWAELLNNAPAGEMVDSPQWVAKPWPWAVHSPPQLSPQPFASGRWAPPVPSPWGPGNWWMHQYQGDAFPVPGFSNTVDLSRFNVMTQGENGARVRWVQQRLGLAGNGVYGPVMAAALRTFQRQNGLVEDGIIGPKTFAPLTWCAGVERPLAAA